MDVQHLIAQFTPEQLAALKAQLDAAGLDESGRSPFNPRQLDNLTLRPTATDPRPTFFWSAEAPRHGDLSKTSPFPRLLWHEGTGQEITVYTQAEMVDKKAHGYIGVPPASVVVDPVEQMRAALDALSEEDRALLIEANKQERLGKLKAQLAELPEGELSALLAQAGTEPKRGPGRPRKDAA